MQREWTLGSFLRARREVLQPSDAGLPTSPRRRTPGLRREEVATLAGVSVDYLRRLEQGRDTAPSIAVLRALSEALRMDEDQRAYLGKLAACEQAEHNSCGPIPATPTTTVAPTITMLLDALAGTPAFVLDPCANVLAANDSWRWLVAPLGMLDAMAGDPPNLARYVFCHPRAATTYPDWERAADEQVNQLRAATARWGAHPGLLDLVQELSAASTAFRQRWSAHSVAEKRTGKKRLVHPTAGELRVVYESLQIRDEGEQRLISWLPADDATRRAFDGLDADARPALPTSPAQLRAVR